MSRLARQAAVIAVSLVTLLTGGACDDPVSVQMPSGEGPAPVYRAGFFFLFCGSSIDCEKLQLLSLWL